VIYLKSALVGLAAIVIAELVVIVAGITALVVIASRRPSGSEGWIGWDPISFARTPAGWIILVVAFVTGFWWEHRRLVLR
jgi:small-conductance mechanosensitive channel